MVEVWDSEEALDAFAAILRAVLSEAGVSGMASGERNTDRLGIEDRLDRVVAETTQQTVDKSLIHPTDEFWRLARQRVERAVA